jgi:hypothetical protein
MLGCDAVSVGKKLATVSSALIIKLTLSENNENPQTKVP